LISIEFVQQIRPIVNPNDGFKTQLLQFEASLLRQQQQLGQTTTDQEKTFASDKEHFFASRSYANALSAVDFDDSVATCIIPNLLYLGGEYHAADIEQLAKLNIKVNSHMQDIHILFKTHAHVHTLHIHSRILTQTYLI
jgi:hypothetical protein